MRRPVFTPAAASLLAAAVHVAAAGPARCISDWSVAARIVADKNLATVEDVSRTLAARNLGTLVRATLCESDGRYVYRVILRDSRGKLSVLVLDARRPQG